MKSPQPRSKIFFLAILFFLKPDRVPAQDWRTADRSSVGVAPLPTAEPRAVVQVYAARAFGWKGRFAVHSWVAMKVANGPQYDVYEVIGYYSQSGTPVIRHSRRAPDQRWFGNDPDLLFEARGESAEKMIPAIMSAIASYPYPDSYRLWPGPNSNTFVSHILRNTPGISVELPPTAIGKDWIGAGRPVGITESGTGVQVSLLGAFGFSLGLAEGIEVNLLGMTFGIDFWRPALKLPFIGRLGFSDKPVFGNSFEEEGPDSAKSIVKTGT
jgi:hypothetical protein